MATNSRRRADQIERRVYFFRACLRGLDPGGLPYVFDPSGFMRILRLVEQSKNRYLEAEEGHVLSVWPMEPDVPELLTFGNIQRDALPQIDEGGIWRFLQLPQDAGVLHLSHIVLFPDGVVAAETHQHGPRLSQLSQFVAAKVQGYPPISFDPLINRSVVDRLHNLGDLRLVHFRIKRTYQQILNEKGINLAASFEGVDQDQNGETIEVSLRWTGPARRSIVRRALDTIIAAVADPESRPAFERADVRGYNSSTGQVESFDLLREQIVTVRKGIRQDERHRVIQSEHMFYQIRTAYTDLRPEIERAVAVGS
jgi:hypothetical protein